MVDSSSISQLAELLGGHAKPVIRSHRLAPATTYDIDYRMVIVALTFHAHGTKTTDNVLRIDSARMKLLQFVAQRPNMIRAMREWSQSGHASGLLRDSPQRLRRGYLGDSTHDQVVEYMAACKIIRPNGRYLTEEKTSSYIFDVNSAAIAQDMFASERAVLRELLAIRVTNAMLKGQ